jgi:hypothetical protein
MSVADLTRIDSRVIPDNRDEVRVFMTVGDDMLRLESVLRHYRERGAHRFLIIDSGSTDGTLDYLASVPDVHVFSAPGEGDALDRLNALLDRYGSGHWALTVDADELFIYPHCEQIELPLLCRYLNYVGSQAVPCLSLDMYAASPIGDAVHRPGAPLIETCRYFDAAPYRMVSVDVGPYFEIHGGLRERLSADASRPAVLTRVPLVRWQQGTRYLRGTANITPVRISSIMAALLRFELLSDCIAGRDGIALGDDASTNFYYAGSVRFEDSAQLVELALMKTSKPYEESVQLTAATRAARSA